jgi:hypothetical protein
VAFCVTGQATTATTTAGVTTSTGVLSSQTKCLIGKVPSSSEATSGNNEWHNLTATYTKAPALINGVPQPQAILYVDGVPVAKSDPPQPLIKHTAPFPQPQVVANNSTVIGKKFKGKLDDVRLYNVALTLDDVGELAWGCKPATFDPKTGKVSIPCVVEEADEGYTVGAWTVDLLALPPTKMTAGYGGAAIGGEINRNLAFTVAAAKPLPVPVGKPAAMAPGDGPLGWNPSEYPWGAFVASYYQSSNPYMYDYGTVGWIDGGWNAYLYIPAVSVPSPFGAPVKDCYGAYLYYSLNNGRFVMDYTDVWTMHANCGVGVEGWGWDIWDTLPPSS